MPRLSGGAGAQSALAQAAGGVPPRSTSGGQLPESQVAPCGAASAVARPYGVPESGQTSHNGGVLVRRGFRNSNRNTRRDSLCLGPFSEWATIRPKQPGDASLLSGSGSRAVSDFEIRVVFWYCSRAIDLEA